MHCTISFLYNVGKGWFSNSTCRVESQPFWTYFICIFGWNCKSEFLLGRQRDKDVYLNASSAFAAVGRR
jgi:hypothetical protein